MPCASTRTAASCGSFHASPGLHRVDRRLLRGEHELVDLALRRR